MASSTAYAATPEWKLSESKGDVNILRSGVSKIAISGGTLRAGDVVATGKHSRAVLVRGEEYVVVSPHSRLRISAPKKSGGVIQFFEEVGNVLFRIDKKATPHFGVKTPYLAAVVKGTTFSVTVSESGAAVQVTEGAVQVSTLDGGASQLLSPGMIGMVKQDQQYRLSITGSENKTITSPNAPANDGGAGDDGSSESSTVSKETASAEIRNGDYDGVISAPVVDTPISFSQLTGGLVSDNAAGTAPIQLASNALNMQAGDPTSSFKNGRPFNSNASDNDNGAGSNASGNSNANNAGGGNANIGVGNGNGGGKSSNPGNGAGSSNAGGNANNGTGNSNGGGKSNNPGNGAGSSNAGGNSNGAGNSNAGGNGVSNGNAGGNGNGASNSNNAGSGNANNGVGNGNGGGKSGNRGNGAGNSNAGGNGNGAGNSNAGGNGASNSNNAGSGNANNGAGNGNSGSGNGGGNSGNRGNGK